VAVAGWESPLLLKENSTHMIEGDGSLKRITSNLLFRTEVIMDDKKGAKNEKTSGRN
jgi:hypothetical protein